MVKKKLKRFRENKTFSHLHEYNYVRLQKEPFPWKGRWSKEYFRNDNPITLELGCGKGEYTIALSKWYPERNFIGIDLKGARLWRGCKTVEEENIRNVAFIRSRADFLEDFFGENEISEIWITFPDPQMQSPRRKKRLTSPRFMNHYLKILKPGGMIHLKTDNEMFYEYTLNRIKESGSKILYASDDVYHSDAPKAITEVQTFYEQMHLEKGKTIKYVNFILKQDEK
ncbi:MAG: tRNA (guanosine(46)-N7)-methyltransferase TrmB [Bacteroidales bacterium]|nr:tRNA (guanosine(46)-N7)-methyltransferase TrmB [Bacteroidales bacterium]MCF8398786.1 tRNA (guanosine(46)-N7)-methyltransferase TrmB [Bacteroidales bacterium]